MDAAQPTNSAPVPGGVPVPGNVALSAVPVPDDRYRDLGRLLVVCPDRPGIVAAVTRFLHQHSANITESQQYSTDPFGGTFFLRIQFYLADLAGVVDRLREGFAAVAGGFGMRWRLSQAGTVKRVALFASRADHALQEILWRNRAGDLHAEIGMVISNHPDLYPVAAAWGVPYHHIPVSRQTRVEAERAQLDLLRGNGERGDTDLIVLARYMQILSPAFLAQYPNRIINIHHGFLPAFVGANPYQGAHDRGVKLIGATAHYATEELDAGPIIEQDVARVDHRHDVAQLRRIGRQVERDVLYRAVSWHLEDRVLVHGNKTIVFA